MGVSLCHLNAGMTEQLADLKERCAIHHQPTRKGMAQVVDMKILHPCPTTLPFRELHLLLYNVATEIADNLGM